MKTVGLIGGMSWPTTAVYYQEINQSITARLGGIHSAKLLLHSLDYADVAQMVSSRDSDSLTTMICEAGQGLKAAGAEGLVLCANVAHKTANSLETASGLPVLHIVDFTGRAIVDQGFKKVGLLATRAVMEEEFYKARLRDHFGLDVYVPDSAFRADADRMIFHEMSKTPIAEDVKSIWRAACADLVRVHDVDCVVLACTELRLVFDSETSVPTFETTMLHARGIANWMLEGCHSSLA